MLGVKNILIKSLDYFLPKYSKNFLWNKLGNTLKKCNFNKIKLLNSRILITGGTGYVGSWVVHGLASINETYKLNIEITLLTSNPKNLNKYSYLNKKIKINYKLNEISKFIKIKKKYTHLIHAAAKYKGNKKEINKTNILGSKNIIKFIDYKKIENIIFLSSGAVYDYDIEKIKLQENAKKINYQNKDYYAQSKFKSEEMFLDYAKKNKINLSILRLFSFAGPGTSSLKYLAYTTAIDARLKNNNIHLYSDGNSYRSFMHSIDMSCWIVKSLTNEGKTIINVGSDKEMKIIDLVNKILKYKKLGFKRIKIIKKNKSQGNTYYVPLIKKALRKNFYLFHTFTEAIRDDIIHRKQTRNAHRYFYK